MPQGAPEGQGLVGAVESADSSEGAVITSCELATSDSDSRFPNRDMQDGPTVTVVRDLR